MISQRHCLLALRRIEREMSKSATIVIPNWSGLVHLEACLSALRGQSLQPTRVILVDNASNDGSKAFVRESFPEIEWVQMPKNGGFSYAVNEGIRRADTEYVALLDNDTVAEPGWLQALVDALERHADYDIAASRMVLHYERHLVNAAGDVYQLSRMAGVNRGLLEPVGHYDTSCRVLGACAGAALYRRALFDRVGLFDEDFFLMSEDTDINLRALIAGARCIYAPSAIVYHKLRASISAKPPEEMLLLGLRNQMIVFARNMPWSILVLVPVIWGFFEFRATLPLRPREWHKIPRLLADLPTRLRHECEGLRLGLAKRHSVWAKRRIGSAEITRWVLKGTGPL